MFIIRAGNIVCALLCCDACGLIGVYQCFGGLHGVLKVEEMHSSEMLITAHKTIQHTMHTTIDISTTYLENLKFQIGQEMKVSAVYLAPECFFERGCVQYLRCYNCHF
jgi:hypothetical protein